MTQFFSAHTVRVPFSFLFNSPKVDRSRSLPAPLLLLALAAFPAACKSASNDNQEQLGKIEGRLDSIDATMAKLVQSAKARPNPPKRGKKLVADELYKVELSANDPSIGGPSSKVSVVLATEYACPYCSSLAATLEELYQKYSDEELRVVPKPFVIHPSLATKAALAACAAQRQGVFADFDSQLWKRAWSSGALDKGALSEPKLVGLATELGVDVDLFVKDTQNECKAQLAKDRANWRALGVGGTPAIFINGRYYRGGRDASSLTSAIDKAMKSAEIAMGRGVPLEELYSSLIAKGRLMP